MTLVIGLLFMAIFGTVTALVSSLSTLYAMRFFSAVMTSGVFQISIVLGQ